MLRVYLGSAARTAARHTTLSASAALRPAAATLFVRLNSTQTPPSPASTKPPRTPEQLKRKAALEKQDDLQRDWDSKTILYEDFLHKTKNASPDAYIIDVREPDEVIQGMIPSAVNLPLSVLGGAFNTHHTQFKEKYGFEKPRKNQELVFYCRSGMRSKTACDVAKRNGFTNIINYQGSWLEWTAKQNEKSSS